MNVLSLFDGMSCGMIALERAGIDVDNYYASEIDKYAIKISNKNYPDIHRLGDITRWKKWDLPKIDLIMGGSPCQGFSFSGNQLAFDDPRSKLFFEFLEIYRCIRCFNPKVKFLLENVKMKKQTQDAISQLLGVEPIEINSALVSAQSRKRLYWTNIAGITQPADKGILLKDILESCESELSEKELAYMMRSESTTEHRPRILRAKSPDEKSNTLTGSMHKGVPHGVISKNFTIMSDKFCNRNASILRDDFDGKAKSFSAMEYVKNGRQGDYIKCGAMRGRQIGNDPTYIQQLEIRADDKTNTLTTAQKDNYVVSENRLIRGDDATDINGHDILKRTYLANGKGPTLNSCGGGNTHAKLQIKPKDDNGCIREYNYRKLTPVECERLQTIPDNFTEGCSNTQRYKMIGNGWTIDVITHILNFLEKNND